VAFPDRPVVGVVSDGASLYTITSLWTAAHHRLPVTYVLCNNRSYRILKQNLREYRRPEEGARPFVHMDLTDPEMSFVRLAEGFGVAAQRIERPEEVAPALRKAIERDEPVLLDVVLDGTP
jgi:benzoylformate decarboxylase